MSSRLQVPLDQLAKLVGGPCHRQLKRLYYSFKWAAVSFLEFRGTTLPIGTSGRYYEIFSPLLAIDPDLEWVALPSSSAILLRVTNGFVCGTLEWTRVINSQAL